jgi:hypothetical protein
MLNIIKLYEDYSIPIWTEGPNCQPGWVNTTCPWCDDISNHLGYSLEEDYYHCWRCKWHSTVDTVAKLIGVSAREAKTIIRQYSEGYIRRASEPKVTIHRKAFKFPTGVGSLQPNHKRYLESRRFDPDELEYDWDLIGTGPISSLDEKEYKHRIIAPIFWDGKIVSFQGRDITNRHKLRYKACPQDRELIPHKTILYGKQTSWTEIGIIVEGITDVWRFGPLVCATLGIEFTRQQVRLISKLFKRIFVVYDNQPQAAEQAKRLTNELGFRGREAYNITVPNYSDPASMPQDEADYFVKQLI